MQTVFVTGASGFIGTHLVGEILRRGVGVKCLVRSSSRVEHLGHAGVELVSGDLEAPQSYSSVLQGCDAVFHLAGLVQSPSPQRLLEVNGNACGRLANVCAAADNPPRLVYVSSVAAAGPPPAGKEIRDESDPPQPVSHYGRSKRQGEIELQKQAGTLPVTVIRPGIVFGPGDAALADLYRGIRHSHLHIVIGFRTPPLALIYVDDLVQLLLRAVEDGETLQSHFDGRYSPQGYYFACDDAEFPNYWDLGERIARSMDQRVLVWPLWRWLGYTVPAAVAMIGPARLPMVNADKIREALARSWACSSEKSRQQLGFSTPYSIDQRLRQTAHWYEHHGWLDRDQPQELRMPGAVGQSPRRGVAGDAPSNSSMPRAM